MELPGYIVDLARLERIIHQVNISQHDLHRQIQTVVTNPTLKIVTLRWSNLAEFIRTKAKGVLPRNQPDQVMVWRHPQTNEIRFRQAKHIDLLALKLIVEQIDLKEASALGKATPGDLQQSIDRAVSQGILLAPGSKIRRAPLPAGKMDPRLEPFLSSDVFTLQWHITQTCDLRCKHCYDRSDRPPMTEKNALGILEELYDFCRRMHVRGQVTFTGGNPLLYPISKTSIGLRQGSVSGSPSWATQARLIEFIN